MLSFNTSLKSTRAAPSVDSPTLSAHKEKHVTVLSVPPTTPREQIILFAIHDRELYGLEVQRVLSECGGDNENLTLGTIYPALRSLEKKGLISGRWGDEDPGDRTGARRRYYQLTELGFATVEATLSYHQRLLNWRRSEPVLAQKESS
jgi:PadR family transcriptional regulator, regulatory protein PadR